MGSGSDIRHKRAGKAGGVAIGVDRDTQRRVLQRLLTVALLIGIISISVVMIELGINCKEFTALGKAEQGCHRFDGFDAVRVSTAGALAFTRG